MKILLNLTARKDYMKVTKVHIIIFYEHTHTNTQTEADIYIYSEGLFFYIKQKGEKRKISFYITTCNFLRYLPSQNGN